MAKNEKLYVQVEKELLIEHYAIKQRINELASLLIAFAEKIGIDNPQSLTVNQLRHQTYQTINNKILNIVDNAYNETETFVESPSRSGK